MQRPPVHLLNANLLFVLKTLLPNYNKRATLDIEVSLICRMALFYFYYYYCYFETESSCGPLAGLGLFVDHSGLKLAVIFLPASAQCWANRRAPPYCAVPVCF